MQIMVRDRDIGDLVGTLRGKRVTIWTCNTCARLCNIGGSMNAQRLASALRSEGIEVVAVRSVKASCVMSSVEECREQPETDCDIILALTCTVGARVAGTVFGRDVVNPVEVVGNGYLDGSGDPVVMTQEGKGIRIRDAASERGLHCGPFC